MIENQMILSDIQELDQNIKEAQKIVDQATCLERLMNNRDFKKVILEGYFQKEAIRLVHLKADSNMQTPERQASIISQIDAIGSLVAYFQSVTHQGSLAVKAIAQDEQTREELLNEGDYE